MARIRGRSDDMLIIRGVNVFPSQIEELVAQDPRLAPHYELHVSRTGSLDELLVKVEASQNSDDAAAAGKDLAKRIKGIIGTSAIVTVLAPMTLERSQGKAKRVFDTRPR